MTPRTVLVIRAMKQVEFELIPPKLEESDSQQKEYQTLIHLQKHKVNPQP